MSKSTWDFTLVTEANGVERTQPGTVDGPVNATEETILAVLLDHIRQTTYRGVNFRVISFTATRLA